MNRELTRSKSEDAAIRRGAPHYSELPDIFVGGLKVEIGRLRIWCQVVRHPDGGLGRPMLIVVYQPRERPEGFWLPVYDDPEAAVPRSFPDPRTLLFQSDVLDWVSENARFRESVRIEICAPRDLEQYRELIEKGVRCGTIEA